MPVYEYRCSSCNQVFEYQQRMADPPKKECEACKGELERRISRSAFQFKGGGWYKDLYSSSKSDAKPAPAGGSDSGSSSSGSTGGSSSGSGSTSGGDSGGSSGSSASRSGGGSATPA